MRARTATMLVLVLPKLAATQAPTVSPVTAERLLAPNTVRSHLADGPAARTGRETVTFAATAPGTYLVACGVSGHATSGMGIRMVVSGDATAPSYR